MYNRRPEPRRPYLSNIDAASRHNSSLLFEFGTSFVRVGITGECKPRHIFVLPKCDQTKLSSSSSLYWSSFPPLPSRLSHQIRDSSDYKDLGPWLSHLYTTLLIKPRSRRVIIILPVYHPPELRNALQSALLDDLNVPSIFFTNTFCCIPYAIGSTTGIIIDIGCIEGRVACYFNGRTCEDTLQIVPVGFQSLIHKIISEKHDLSDDEAIFKIRGQEEDVERIINDTYFGGSPNSLICAFFNSLLKCPIDIRKQVVANVVFVGGGVDGIPYFQRRFMKFIQDRWCHKQDSTIERKNDLPQKFSSLIPVITAAPMKVFHPLKFLPSNVAWVGGSIMGGLKRSNDVWIDRDSKKS